MLNWCTDCHSAPTRLANTCNRVNAIFASEWGSSFNTTRRRLHLLGTSLSVSDPDTHDWPAVPRLPLSLPFTVQLPSDMQRNIAIKDILLQSILWSSGPAQKRHLVIRIIVVDNLCGQSPHSVHPPHFSAHQSLLWRHQHHQVAFTTLALNS